MFDKLLKHILNESKSNSLFENEEKMVQKFSKKINLLKILDKWVREFNGTNGAIFDEALKEIPDDEWYGGWYGGSFGFYHDDGHFYVSTGSAAQHNMGELPIGYVKEGKFFPMSSRKNVRGAVISKFLDNRYNGTPLNLDEDFNSINESSEYTDPEEVKILRGTTSRGPSYNYPKGEYLILDNLDLVKAKEYLKKVRYNYTDSKEKKTFEVIPSKKYPNKYAFISTNRPYGERALSYAEREYDRAHGIGEPFPDEED